MQKEAMTKHVSVPLSPTERHKIELLKELMSDEKLGLYPTLAAVSRSALNIGLTELLEHYNKRKGGKKNA